MWKTTEKILKVEKDNLISHLTIKRTEFFPLADGKYRRVVSIVSQDRTLLPALCVDKPISTDERKTLTFTNAKLDTKLAVIEFILSKCPELDSTNIIAVKIDVSKQISVSFDTYASAAVAKDKIN